MVMGTLRQETEVAIIGAGPGGYVAALRAAALGREVVLIDDRPRPGGVCLHEGCIPSKALLHAADVLNEARGGIRYGIHFDAVRIDREELVKHTREVVDGLARGVERLLAAQGVERIQGRARFEGPSTLRLEGEKELTIEFRHCVVASGSRPRKLADIPEGLLWTSQDAVQLPEIPARLLLVGGGYIGLELGLVYTTLGSKVTLLEATSSLLPGADSDLVAVARRELERRFEGITLEAQLLGLEDRGGELLATVQDRTGRRTIAADRVLVAVGRVPNTDDLGLERAGIAVDARGLIPVDASRRTRSRTIYAIGDVVEGIMLAHKASREGKIAADHLSGRPAAFDNRAMPAVVFTDPELAWAGLTEREAAEKRMEATISRFPLRALGRAHILGAREGLVKIISDPKTMRILGVGLVGPRISELIAEATLAMEMGALAEDLAVTIHPHPTLSEGLMEAAELVLGLPVHVKTVASGREYPQGSRG